MTYPGSMENQPITGFADFWPYYLRAHSRRGNRILHVVGGLIGLAMWAVAWTRGSWGWFFSAFPVGYAFAWTGHFGIEGNRPATFGHPLKSFVCEVCMVLLAVTGQLGRHLDRHGIPR